MGRGYAYAHKAGSRPYGQPKENFRESTPRPESVGPSRNVRQVMDTSVMQAEPNAKHSPAVGKPVKGDPLREVICATFISKGNNHANSRDEGIHPRIA